MNIQDKEIKHQARRARIRTKISGSQKRPRLAIHRSLNNLTAQVIDDTLGKTLVGLSTFSKVVAEQVKNGGNVEGAKIFGKLFAEEALKKGIKLVAFDRGGYLYHGRVKAFAEAAREAGMEF